MDPYKLAEQTEDMKGRMSGKKAINIQNYGHYLSIYLSSDGHGW